MMSFMRRLGGSTDTLNPRSLLDRFNDEQQEFEDEDEDHNANGGGAGSEGCEEAELSFESASHSQVMCLRSPMSPPIARHSSTPHYKADKDVEEEDKHRTALTYSPPYKRVRALKLFDSPLTPKSIIARQSMTTTPMPRSRLFSDRPRPVPSSYSSRTSDKPTANVNPFTPDGLLMNKKRSRSLRSLDSPGSIPKFDLSGGGDGYDSDDPEIQQPTKRVALQENNISRYHQEFHEVELIGSGQFGSVYKCLNRLDGCLYAIKKSTRPVAGSSFEKSAMNEVYAHAVLGKHRHVVRYYSAWAEDNHMIIQNEHCNGGSLADRIQRGGRLSEEEVRNMLLQVAEGLHYIHSQGLVHMDIKPGNIFISKEKRTLGQILGHHDSADDGFEELDDSTTEETTYKIGDLGHVTSLTNPKVEEGDCRYLPNEILHEQYDHLSKADIFALGLTALECLGMGPMPKNGELWHEIRQGPLPHYMRPQHTSPALIELVESMIDPKPCDRPSADSILHHPVLSPPVLMSKEQLRMELDAEKKKNQILTRKFIEVAKCLKAYTGKDVSLTEVINTSLDVDANSNNTVTTCTTTTSSSSSGNINNNSKEGYQ